MFSPFETSLKRVCAPKVSSDDHVWKALQPPAIKLVTLIRNPPSNRQVASGPYQAEPMMDLSFTNPTDNVLPADDDLLFITEGLGNQDLAQILGLGSPTNMNMGSPVPSPGAGGHSPGPSSPSGQQMNMTVNSENINKVSFRIYTSFF